MARRDRWEGESVSSSAAGSRVVARAGCQLIPKCAVTGVVKQPQRRLAEAAELPLGKVPCRARARAYCGINWGISELTRRGDGSRFRVTAAKWTRLKAFAWQVQPH